MYHLTKSRRAAIYRESPIQQQAGAPSHPPTGSNETSASGHLESIPHLNARTGEAGGARFWFHALRDCFITVADRELMLPTRLTKRLVNHAPPPNVTQGYASNWTMEQLRDAAQGIADRIDELTRGAGPPHEVAS